MAIQTRKVTFQGAQGDELAARLDLPAGAIRAYALFAHCFTCSKDIFAASRIAGALAERGIAVLRFDFTGLGMSDGEFANINFSSNVADLVMAADYLRQNFEAPAVLIGHSLGGAAVLAAAGEIAEAKAVATIGAPADAAHVAHNFHASLEEIEKTGEAEVSLGGRPFTIKKQFLDDIREHTLEHRIAKLKKALLIFHSPVDDVVGIDNAAAIFQAAKHPKSFVSLDGADHLLHAREDAVYVADVLSAWADRFIARAGAAEKEADDLPAHMVEVAETGNGKFQQTVRTGHHTLLADEPKDAGGLDSGPSPYDFLNIALGTCTAMTLRMYADHKKIDPGRISVRVGHEKVHADDCRDCGEGKTGHIDRFERHITLSGDLPEDVRRRFLEIADKCPVHKTLHAGVVIATDYAD